MVIIIIIIVFIYFSDPNLKNLVELILNIEGSSLTVSQEQSLEAKLSLLLRNAVIHVRYLLLLLLLLIALTNGILVMMCTLNCRQLTTEHNTGRAILVFYAGDVAGDKTVMSGPQVVTLLKQKLKQDSSLLELSVANIQTVVCQNNCSGHGTCDESSRRCLCEAFWMQSFVRKYFGDGESNCGTNLEI